jgi:hypothetical protein
MDYNVLHLLGYLSLLHATLEWKIQPGIICLPPEYIIPYALRQLALNPSILSKILPLKASLTAYYFNKIQFIIVSNIG